MIGGFYEKDCTNRSSARCRLDYYSIVAARTFSIRVKKRGHDRKANCTDI